MTQLHPRILIIDDDPGLRKTLADILLVKGYEVLAAGDGAGGHALLAGNIVNLVLLDLTLPDISGVELLGRIKADYPSTEVIILTGNATIESAIKATNMGAFSYLLKPYDVDQLLVNIKRAIEKQQANENLIRRNIELQNALDQVKTLSGIITICMQCKKIHNPDGSWEVLESYITKHTDALFSHGLCKECCAKLYPDYHIKPDTN
jgi:DNA-binding NtrC family response regulator